jgi:integrase
VGQPEHARREREQHRCGGTYEPEERSVATLPQVFALAEAIQPRYRLAVLLDTFASLRFGELMGLQRRHLLVEGGQIAQAAIQPNSGRTFDGDPKERSNRTLTLPHFLTEEIEHHLGTYVGRSPNAYVFLGPKEGARRAPTSTASGTRRGCRSGSTRRACAGIS